MGLPSYRWRAAHLAALWAYGVAQPVFSMLQANPEFLVVRGSTRADVVAFALLLVLVPPLAVIALEALVATVSTGISRALHIVAIGCFAFVAALQLLRLLEPERAATLLVPLAPAVLAAFVYLRWRPFRSFLSISLALPAIGLVAFVATVPLAVDDQAGADVEVRTQTPVVLVVLDEFPVSSLLKADGSIDATRYPSFAALAHDGVWYPRAATVAEFTTKAVPAILTGRLPGKGELPTLADHPENLFTLLGERYALEVTEPVTRLCPSRYCPEAHTRPPLADRQRGLFYDTGVAYLFRVLPSSLRVELPPIGDRWGGFGEDGDGETRERLLGALDAHDVDLAVEREDHRPRAQFERFLDSIHRGAPSRSLYFAHLMLPHSPWRLLPSGREYGNAVTIDGILDDFFNNWSTSPWLVDQALQRHLLQVGYTDRLLGRLVRRLKETGSYDRALVVVTADHGVSFAAGGSRRFVTSDNVADIAGIPLFVKYPGSRQGRIDRRAARTVDIVPTIADVVGVELPWPVDGRSLRAAPVVREISVARREGDPVTARASAVEAGVRAAARRNARLLGEGHDSMYRIGPHPELLGRDVASLSVVPAGAVGVRLDGESLYGDVRLAGGFVPARVAGEIEGGPLAAEAPLAIAVNGKIAATTRVFALDGRPRFAALVPEGAFREGANAVDVYSIATGQGGPRLSLLGGTGRAPLYALDTNGRGIVLPTGKRASIAAGRLAGAVESSTVEDDTVRIRGWAADVREDARVDRVLLFAGHRLLFASSTSVYRFDIDGVSETVGLQRVGFVAEVPVRDVGQGDLRAFALRGRVATELEWPESRVTAGTAAGNP